MLYNNAGGATPKDGKVTDMDLDEFWRTIGVDLFGTFLGCRFAIPVMVEGGGGSIINTTSIRAMVGTAGADAYSAAKGGVRALTQALALQWAAHNIRVNAIAPGVILTERVKALLRADDPIYQKSLLGASDPEDVAQMALYLASDAVAPGDRRDPAGGFGRERDLTGRRLGATLTWPSGPARVLSPGRPDRPPGSAADRPRHRTSRSGSRSRCDGPGAPPRDRRGWPA